MKQIAEILLKIKAVSLDPNFGFTWASGIKAPIYCDNRLIISFPEYRKLVAKAFSKLIEEKFPATEVIVGTATAGIPHAAWVSDIMNLPMCYVRSKSKEHGKSKRLEGFAKPGQKMLVLEDLISTGKSSLEAVRALQEENYEVLGVVAIFSYGLEKSHKAFADAQIPYYSLSNFSELAQLATEQKYLSSNDVQKIAEWMKSLEA